MTRRTPFLLSASLGLVLAAGGLAALGPTPPQPLPVGSKAYGRSYADWSAAWWRWALSLPLDGHPFLDTPTFDVTAGQSGAVWFLAAPVGAPCVRHCRIPVGKALFIALVDSEWSSLEGFPTEADQRAEADLFGDHIRDTFCTIDGVAVSNLGRFRVPSAQFTFTAPSPWIFGDAGGTGTTVADGYYVLLQPLSAGHHTIHFGGAFHFAVAEGDDFDLNAPVDMTYDLTVEP